MKQVLFASTATAALVIGGMASAQGIALFGDARLGLGYNIDNAGGELTDDPDFEDDVRAVSRVRFGVNMTGTTNSDITFGATIRADNAQNGQGSDFGQRAGNVFISGAFGTLTYGDTNGADEQHVGDLPGNFSLTGLGDPNETLYLSNGGDLGPGIDAIGRDFASDPNARPTVRYDYEFAGFGLSASTDRDLEDVAVGGSYTFTFGGNSFTAAAGYLDYSGFPGGDVDDDADGLPDDFAESGEMYSAGLSGNVFIFDAGVIYTKANGDAGNDFETLGAGLTTEIMDFDVGGYYSQIINSTGDADGNETYGLTAQYDLGGGASVNGGVGQTYNDATVADFGVKMSF